jgi:hypothetical protein
MVQILQTWLLVLKGLHVLTCVFTYQTPEFCCRTVKLRTLLFVENTGYDFTALWTTASITQFFSNALMNSTVICKSKHCNLLQVTITSNQYTCFFRYSVGIKVDLHGRTGYNMKGEINSTVMSGEHVRLEPIHTPFKCHRGKYILKA